MRGSSVPRSRRDFNHLREQQLTFRGAVTRPISVIKSSVLFFSTRAADPCENPSVGYFCQLPLKKRHAINVARLRKAATPAELLFRDFLASLGVPYRFQQGFYNPFYRIVDFYLPEHRLVIEIDGPSHTDPNHDRRMDEWFERVRGVRILRLTNDQVHRGEFEGVERFIKTRR